jgi:hypothetical protein
MPRPLAPSPIVLYAKLVEASAALAREIERLDHANTLRLDAAWVHLDELIEQLPDALAADARRQPQGDAGG